MAEKVKERLYPELPLQDVTPLVPKYHSLPQNFTESLPTKKNSNGSSGSPTNQPIDLDPTDKVHGPIPKHYITFLGDYIEKINEILDKFDEIKKHAADYHYKSNCAKVSGTVVSSTGVALVMGSLWWSPLTAGTSLILGAGGAVMSVTGSLTNALTDYIAYKTTSGIMMDIKLLLKQKEMFDTWMRKSLTHFNEYITQLMENGVTREIAISTIIEGIAKGTINIMEKPDNKILSFLSTAVKLQRVQHLAVEALPVIGKTFHMTEKSFQFIYNILGLTGRTVPTFIKEFAKVSGVLSMAFVMADITILIKDLCSEHPSMDIIDKVIEKLKDERDILNDLLDILIAVGSNPEGVFDKSMLDIQMIMDKQDLLKDFVIVNDEDITEKTCVTVQ